ncbi:MAG: iron-containing alcohol dehydrogenase [Clostridia bacterium]|nr:iron-containing alcohol dehydrogenase [Clostridia bacterium]
MEFSYFMPVRLVFGTGVTEQLGAKAKEYGKHALIVTGRNSTKKTGLLDRVIALLKKEGIESTVFDQVEPNPLTTTVMAGAALARQSGCDLVVGLGGGSMMDAAKAVAFCAVNDGDINEYISCQKSGTGCLPILLVPTTCGTGSEANPFAVLTNPETMDKKSLWGDLLYPKVSFVDPELMKTMPPDVLAAVGFDALSHNMEGYLATRAQPITDCLALHGISLSVKSLSKVYAGTGTQEDWENITLASLLGGIVLNTAGVGGGHGMEHPVSGRFNVVHGKGLAALTPPIFRHSYSSKPERYAAISRLLGGKDESDCAEGVERFLDAIHLRCKLRDIGVEESGIEWMTDNCINVFAGSMRNHTKAFTREEVNEIYHEAF